MTGDGNPRVPPTCYAVMALLHSGGSLSGYDVRQWAQRSLRHFYWSPAQSQIYRELARLEQLGWARTETVAQTARPDKKIYTLTEDGIDALTRWLRDPELGATQYKHPAALRLFAGGLVDRDTTRRMLEQHISTVEDQLADLEDLIISIEGDHGARFGEAVARWGSAIHEADLAGAQGVLENLDSLYEP